MKVLILGIDGYIGFPLALRLIRRGHEVFGIDNFFRRSVTYSAIPIYDFYTRLEVVKEELGAEIDYQFLDISSQRPELYEFIDQVKPDCIVHLAEQPSAPFSMRSPNDAVFTQVNNVVGTLNVLFAIKRFCPDCHLLKLGTMGEYGTPNVPIPEGFFEVEYKGRKDVLPFPRQAGSWYHLSKVHDSNNIMFANKVWGLRSTDVMQGVVYGTRTEDITKPELATRFDFDQYFGTALNRFCVQAILGIPLTVYGKGGQTRGFIALRDSVQCLTLALENPPDEGEYRVFNQYDETYSIKQLAEIVSKHTGAEIQHLKNPRVEAEEHFYQPECKKLRELGFRPTKVLDEEIDIMLDDLRRHEDRLRKGIQDIFPSVTWR